jgi:hypothetical protein
MSNKNVFKKNNDSIFSHNIDYAKKYKNKMIYYKRLKNIIEAHETQVLAKSMRQNKLRNQQIKNYQAEYDKINSIINHTIIPKGVKYYKQIRDKPDIERTEHEKNELQFYKNNKHKYEFLNKPRADLRIELLTKKQQELRNLGARELNSIMN